MSLRTQLFLAFATLIGLVVWVGGISYRLNHEIETQVASLRSGPGADLAGIDVRQHGLEIEGYWDESGVFVAREVDLLPGTRRPKLRGAVQQVDAKRGIITLHGVEISLGPETAFSDGPGEVSRLDDLRPGQRIEISARVESGRWLARRIKTNGVKSSDKIKGTPTRVALDRGTLEISGLPIRLVSPTQPARSSPLRDLRLATALTVVLQDLRSATRELVGRSSGRNETQAALGIEPNRLDLDVHGRMSEARKAFAYYLDQLQLESDPNSAGIQQEPRLSILRQHFETLEEELVELETRRSRDLGAARSYLDDYLAPHIERKLLPVVYALREDAEESLSDQVRGISHRARTATRMATVVGVVAVLAVSLLAGAVWRSLAGPVRALHGAALRIGQGHFDTRIEIEAGKELGDLADAFNHMAEALATTTVSVDSLESIFDSMAGILITLDSEKRITNVNRGALEFLGYAREELLDRPFGLICAGSKEPLARSTQCGGEDEIASVEELAMVCRDGSAASVSFSSTEIRPPDGPVQGYICVAQDLTEHKAIEEQVRSSLAQKELLLRELHHRVKNNMQVISSLLAIQASHSPDPNAAIMFEESQRRIQSMALIHEQLHRSSDLARIDIPAYLESLTSHLAGSLGPLRSIQIQLDVRQLRMGIDQALVCGLIVNELVTNSFKHAFQSRPKGCITIALWDEDEHTRVLEVTDDGPGLQRPAGADEPTLGLALVGTLAKQLDGHLAVVPSQGARFRIEFPPDCGGLGAQL